MFTTLLPVLAALVLSSSLVQGLEPPFASHVVPRDNPISPLDRYCPWCWANLSMVDDPTSCHIVIQAPTNVSIGSGNENTDAKIAILSHDFKELYAWNRLSFAEGSGLGTQQTIPFDIRYPGLRQFNNSSVTVAMVAYNLSNNVPNDTFYLNQRPSFWLYLPFNNTIAVDIDGSDDAWNHPQPFNVTVDGSETVFHTQFKCIYN